VTSRALQIESSGCPAPPHALRAVDLAGLRLLSGEHEEVADWLIARARGSSSVVVAHVNLNNYYELCHWSRGAGSRTPELELIFDGIGLKLAARAFGQGWVRDVSGTDLFPLVMRRAAAERLRVFFLGSTSAVVHRAAEQTLREFPGVVLAGVQDGYFSRETVDSVVERVRLSQPDLLLIGMGCPRQEGFALDYQRLLGAKLIWTIGGLFDFLSGAKPRAPRWMRRVRLEWLFRWLIEPRRMWRRNTVPPVWLAWRVLRWRLRGSSVDSET